jgi:hypothetical protein
VRPAPIPAQAWRPNTEEAKVDRRVRATKKDRSGNIVALCNPGESWSPRKKADVIRDIVTNKKSYYVEELRKRRYLRVVSGKKLETTSDKTSGHNLDMLPEA